MLSPPLSLSPGLLFSWIFFLSPLFTLFLFHSASKYLRNRNSKIQICWSRSLLGFLERMKDEEAVTCHQATRHYSTLPFAPLHQTPFPGGAIGISFLWCPSHNTHLEPSNSWQPGLCSSPYQVPRYLCSCPLLSCLSAVTEARLDSMIP